MNKRKEMTKKKIVDNEDVKPVGRPTDFKNEYVELAYNYCLLGATDKELATFFNVCEATINNWKISNPDFLESIKREGLSGCSYCN